MHRRPKHRSYIGTALKRGPAHLLTPGRPHNELQIEVEGARLKASGWFAILVGAVVLLGMAALPLLLPRLLA